MDILCLMGLFPKEYHEEIEKNSIGALQNAANKLQWAIVRGLDAIDGVDVSILNSLYIGSYPKRYKEKHIPTFSFEHAPGAKDLNVGFCNISVIKWFSRYFTVKKALKKWAKASSDKQKVLLVYALTIPFTQIAGYVKRKYPHIKVCIVVPDLPEYMSPGKMQSDRLFRLAKKAEVSLIKHSIKRTDAYVFLTDTMKEWFDTSVRYTVVEGIAADVDKNSDGGGERQHSILYAGGIAKEYGLVDLVEAFIAVNPSDWELVLYGSGPASATIAELAQGYPNIKVMGRAPNAEVVKAQRNASVLINPRKNQVFTRYSFPSKIMEYMSSGTPVLAYKLDGMPDEYDPYYYRIPEEEQGMKNALRAVMALSDEERNEMGQRARNFVAENKTPEKQAQKIVKLLAELK